MKHPFGIRFDPAYFGNIRCRIIRSPKHAESAVYQAKEHEKREQERKNALQSAALLILKITYEKDDGKNDIKKDRQYKADNEDLKDTDRREITEAGKQVMKRSGEFLIYSAGCRWDSGSNEIYRHLAQSEYR